MTISVRPMYTEQLPLLTMKNEKRLLIIQNYLYIFVVITVSCLRFINSNNSQK